MSLELDALRLHFIPDGDSGRIVATPIRLRVDGGELSIDGRVVARSDWAQAYVQPTVAKDEALVRLLDTKGRTTNTFKLSDELHANALLAALGLEPGQRVTFNATRGVFVFASVMSLLGFLVASAALIDASLVLGSVVGVVGLALTLLFARFGTYSVHIAGDGVRVDTAVGERFIRYEDIESVHGGRSLDLKLHSGETLKFALESDSITKAGAQLRPQDGLLSEGGTALALIERAMQHHGGDGGLSAKLAQGGRHIDDWLRSIASMGVARYRIEAPSRGQLWGVVEGTSLEPTARAAAARILIDGLEESGRERLRIAAQGCASLELRAAIEAAAEAEQADDTNEALALLADQR